MSEATRLKPAAAATCSECARSGVVKLTGINSRFEPCPRCARSTVGYGGGVAIPMPIAPESAGRGATDDAWGEHSPTCPVADTGKP